MKKEEQIKEQEHKATTGWVFNAARMRLTYLVDGKPKGGFVGDTAERAFKRMLLNDEIIYING